MPLSSNSMSKIGLWFSAGVLLVTASAVAASPQGPASRVMATVSAECPAGQGTSDADGIRISSTSSRDGTANLSITCGGRTFSSSASGSLARESTGAAQIRPSDKKPRV